MNLGFSLPTFEEYAELEATEKISLLEKFGISTLYFAIDGTRRYAKGVLIEQNSEFTVENYYEIMKSSFLNALGTLFNSGLKNIIILLHDKTSFERGEKYINSSIKLGIKPLWDDQDYIDFYSENQINVRFAGFNELYSEYGFQYLEEKFNSLQQITYSSDNRRNLIFWTSDTPSEDILRLNKITRINPNLHTLEEFKNHLYGFNVPEIDISLFYGKPREKVMPILLHDTSLRIYTKYPSMNFNDVLMDQVCYFTILHKISINDSYEYAPDNQFENQQIIKSDSSLIWADNSYFKDIAAKFDD